MMRISVCAIVLLARGRLCREKKRANFGFDP
jgi:hypothetical protein